MPDTCLVIGNGPSLRDVPLEFLRKYDSFGTNKIFLLDGFTPTYYVCVNPLVMEQNLNKIKELTCEKYVREGYGIEHQLHRDTRKPFSLRPLEWVNEGYTVTYVCLQLAFYFKYQTVLLVGVDHRYKFDGKPNEKQTLKTDPNHFDPSYFAGQEWNCPDLVRSRMYYQVADDIYKADGRRIINLTRKTALDVFEKDELESWA